MSHHERGEKQEKQNRLQEKDYVKRVAEKQVRVENKEYRSKVKEQKRVKCSVFESQREFVEGSSDQQRGCRGQDCGQSVEMPEFMMDT